MRFSIKALAIAAVIGSLAAGASATTTLNATFNGVSPGANFNYSFDGSSTSTTAGTFNWTSVTGGSVNYGAFTAFCIDLTQNISTGGTYLYNVDPLQNGPTPGTDTGGHGVNGAMGATKAGELDELWGRYFNNILVGTTAQQQQNAAAFQIAVWDIVYGTGLNLTNNSANFHATNGSDPDVVQAQTELNSLNGLGPMANLVALDSSTNQDMVMSPSGTQPAGGAVPEPMTAGLSALGLGGLLLAALRRRRVA